MFATGAWPMPNFAFTNRSYILAITARKLTTGGMNATKRTNNWKAIGATSGESVNGANTSGGNITAITTNIATIATETATEMMTGTATEPASQIVPEKRNGAPRMNPDAPFLLRNEKQN